MTDKIIQSESVALPLAAPRPIGAILVASGKLTSEDVERVLQQQNLDGVRFGDAAIGLGLLTHDDVQYALAQQYGYTYLQEDDKTIAEVLVAAYSPYSHQVEMLRTLRSQLMVGWGGGQPRAKCLSIFSPGQGEGRSVLAANLAIVFAQMGERTLLIDADLRKPCQHELFNLDNRYGFSSLLAGLSDHEQSIKVVKQFPNLSVLTSGAIPPNPQELLSRPALASLLVDFKDKFDVVLLDNSSAGEYSDAQMVTFRAGSALVVARKNQTQLEVVTRQTESLTRSGVDVVGTVLVEF